MDAENEVACPIYEAMSWPCLNLYDSIYIIHFISWDYNIIASFFPGFFSFQTLPGTPFVLFQIHGHIFH